MGLDLSPLTLWLLHLAPWVPATVLAALALAKVSKTHTIVLKLELMMNGKEKPSELPGPQHSE